MAATTTLFLSLFLLILGQVQSQTRTPAQPQAPPPASDACNGIFLTYTYTDGKVVPPILRTDPVRQAYRFESSFSVLNNDLEELKSWRVFVGFQHDEYLVSASNAVLADGNSIPGSVGNGSIFAGFPNPDLRTGIETAGDLTQMSVRVELVGTQFGVGPRDVPMPTNISLVNDGWVCPEPTLRGNRSMEVCCTRDPDFKSNVTLDEEFLPRQNGDLTIMYDVTRTYESNYWAQVTIENHNALGRLDNWQLSWDWMEDEFIFAMRGAYPSVVDTSACMIPFCCRKDNLAAGNGPQQVEISVPDQRFQDAANLNRSDLTPPQNWGISGRINPDYKCGPPVRPKGASPRCCVSFSAYYNESIIPCQTCACGCPANTDRTCSTTAPALFLPSQALLVPFDNRTTLARAWADLHHFPVPNPLPCSDNCGVSMNWHLFTDYRGGWSARITIFNWDEYSFADWFTAIQLDKAAPGFEAVYSFNGTSLDIDGVNNTIFMQGLPGLNYLVAETDGTDPKKDPRVPGKQQSVISFTKKLTPGINIPAGDGFPTKVYFNGEECSLRKYFRRAVESIRLVCFLVVCFGCYGFRLVQQ
ncbi:hypothetical protein DH2020_004425 [Rehmannia glutinosa]|uniref:COBRA C-terminal domain-containing protein n=1 Tax=Rehmannia glutinosa TaxID=99300 RepID=A0ABR0XPF0_REHGL